MYCQVKCQKADWTQEGKHECKELKNGRIEETTRLFTRVLRRLERENGDSEKCKILDGNLIAFTITILNNFKLKSHSCNL